jgi:hypothetical protein
MPSGAERTTGTLHCQTKRELKTDTLSVFGLVIVDERASDSGTLLSEVGVRSEKNDALLFWRRVEKVRHGSEYSKLDIANVQTGDEVTIEYKT